MTPQEYQFIQHKRQLDYQAEVFLHQSKQYMVENLLIYNNEKYYIFMKIRPLIGRRIRIGRRLNVSQPLLPYEYDANVYGYDAICE